MYIQGKRENNPVLNPSGNPDAPYKPERAGYGQGYQEGAATGNMIYGTNVHTMDSNFKPSIKVNAGHQNQS